MSSVVWNGNDCVVDTKHINFNDMLDSPSRLPNALAGNFLIYRSFW